MHQTGSGALKTIGFGGGALILILTSQNEINAPLSKQGVFNAPDGVWCIDFYVEVQHQNQCTWNTWSRERSWSEATWPRISWLAPRTSPSVCWAAWWRTTPSWRRPCPWQWPRWKLMAQRGPRRTQVWSKNPKQRNSAPRSKSLSRSRRVMFHTFLILELTCVSHIPKTYKEPPALCIYMYECLNMLHTHNIDHMYYVDVFQDNTHIYTYIYICIYIYMFNIHVSKVINLLHNR